MLNKKIKYILKQIITFLIIFFAILLLMNLSATTSYLSMTGKLRIYHLIIVGVVVLAGGFIFVFALDKLLTPKSKKKSASDKKKSASDKKKSTSDKKNSTSDKMKSTSNKKKNTKSINNEKDTKTSTNKK